MSQSYIDITDSDDEEDSDPIRTLKNQIEDLFSEDECDKIIALRRDEAAKLSGNKLKQYLDLIKVEINLFDSISRLSNPESLSNTPMSYLKTNAELFKQAKIALLNSVNLSAEHLEELAKKLLKSPSASVAKDIKLLDDTANSIINFYRQVDDPKAIKNLIENTQLVHKKMGTYWRPLKSALTALVGIACIIVGILGLAPTFGASISLIAGGSALCGGSGLALFKPFIPQKAKSANELTKDIAEMMTKAKKLLTYNTKKSTFAEPTANAKQDHVNKPR